MTQKIRKSRENQIYQFFMIYQKVHLTRINKKERIYNPYYNNLKKFYRYKKKQRKKKIYNIMYML